MTDMTDWKTIDSAPKDGTYILLGGDGRVSIGKYHEDKGERLIAADQPYWEPYDSSYWDYDMDGGWFDPTHWMPLPPSPTIWIKDSEMAEELDERPWYERYTEAEVRSEAKRYSEAYSAMIRALRDLPEVPDWRVLKQLGSAAKFPEDAEIGKTMQIQHGLDAIAPKVEYEMGAGLWKRIRDGLVSPISSEGPDAS